MDITFINKRKWLNTDKHSDNGWIKYDVGVDEWHGHPADAIDAAFMVADCSRTISLNFCCYSNNDYANHAKKLDTLIDSLVEFREAMGRAYEYVKTEQNEAGK